MPKYYQMLIEIRDISVPHNKFRVIYSGTTRTESVYLIIYRI